MSLAHSNSRFVPQGFGVVELVVCDIVFVEFNHSMGFEKETVVDY